MQKFWVVNKVDKNTVELIIYGYISKYDVSAQTFSTELKALEKVYKNIHLKINSGGGDVFEGLTIFNLIKGSTATIHAYIDGMCASIAVPLAMACKKVYMGRFSRLMTHRATGYTEGDASSLRTMADLMEGIESDIAQILSERTGLTKDEALNKYILSAGDNWFNAEQALENKLIDGIYDTTDKVDAPKNITDPALLWNYYKPVLLNSFNNEKNINMKSFAIALGLKEDATEGEIINAISALNTSKTNAETDKATAETALQNATTATVVSMVDSAIDSKQLTAAEKDAWVKQYTGNAEGLKMALAKIPAAVKPGAVINMGAGAAAATDAEDEAPKTFDELMKKGVKAVGEFKVSNKAVYNSLYKTKYGFEPKEQK